MPSSTQSRAAAAARSTSSAAESSFGLGERRQHELRQVRGGSLGIGRPDSQPQPRDLLGPQILDHRLHASMPPGASARSARASAQAAGRSRRRARGSTDGSIWWRSARHRSAQPLRFMKVCGRQRSRSPRPARAHGTPRARASPRALVRGARSPGIPGCAACRRRMSPGLPSPAISREARLSPPLPPPPPPCPA